MKIFSPKAIAIFLLLVLFHFSWLRTAGAFSISEERKAGEKLLYTVRTAFPLLDDPDLTQYLSSLGKQVLDVAGLQYFHYHFFIIDKNEFNAFAAPSGLVFFYSGLIKQMNTENELVSVLAHEVGHVVKRHLADRMEKSKIIGVTSIAVALASLALGGGAATQALLTSSLAAGQSANLHFSRQDEEQADLLAYGWMKKMGRNPVGMEKMLAIMRRISRYRSDKLPQYLLTHPNPEARLGYVQSLLASDAQDHPTYRKIDNFAFLRFKYRIMAEADDDGSFHQYLASVVADAHASKLSRTMAEYGLAELARQENDFKHGLELLDKVIDALPDRPILLTDKGVMLYGAGRYGEASQVLQQALLANGDDMYATFMLGKTYQAQGEMNLAKRQFTTVSYELPEFPRVYFALGEIASRERKSGLASLDLGRYYMYEGKMRLARISLQRAVKDGTSGDKVKAQSKQLLETIKRLEKE